MAKSALLLGSLVVFGAVCVAQDTQNLPQLQRVNIPLSLNEERRYVADVNMVSICLGSFELQSDIVRRAHSPGARRLRGSDSHW